MIMELIGAKYAGVLLDLALIGAALSTLWASIKVSYERKVGHPLPRNKVTLFLDVAMDLLPNLPGALHTVAKAQGGRLFLPTAPVAQTPEAPEDK